MSVLMPHPELDPPEANPPEKNPSAALSSIDALVTPAHQRMVRRYVAALSRDPGAVDDLSQEVFVRALERVDRLHKPADAGRFLRGFARHVVQEHFRQRRRGNRYDELTAQALVDDDADPIAEACHDRVLLAALRDAIAGLPLISRRMLEMRYHDGLNATRIGELLEIAPSAVRVSLLRIRQRLRKAVEEAIGERTQF